MVEEEETQVTPSPSSSPPPLPRGIVLVEESEETRQGRRLKVPILKGSAKTKKLKEQAFQINRAKLSNCLPQMVRNPRKEISI